jgi:hypothetical protein
MLARDGGMNVPNIIQGAGSVTTLPRPAADGEPVASQRGAATPGRSQAEPAPNAHFARLAWFDVNGDGHIDPRSTASGGDATLLVPAHTDLPTYARTPTKVGGARVTADFTPDRVATAPANAAQTNRAVDAYQRYGQAATLPPPAPVSAPVSVPARAVA